MRFGRVGATLALSMLAAGCTTITKVTPGLRGPLYHAYDITPPLQAGGVETRKVRQPPAGVVVIDAVEFLNKAVAIGLAATQGQIASQPEERQAVFRNAAAVIGTGASVSLGDALARFEAFSELNPKIASAQRNALAGMLLLASDTNCGLYLDNMRKAQATYRSSFGLTSTVLSGAAGFSTADIATTRLLAGLSTLSGGVSNRLDQAVFADRNADVVIGAVAAARGAMRRQLQDNMKLDYADWRMSQAIADSFAYHGNCSLTGGLSYLALKTGQSAQFNAVSETPQGQ